MENQAQESVDMGDIELFNALLQSPLENIEDLPDFELFPIGSYRVKCENMKVDIQQEKNSAAIKAIFSNMYSIEMANEEAEAPKEGSLLGGQWAKEFGIKKFKKVFLPAMEELGCGSIPEFIEQAPGMEFNITVGQRPDNNGKLNEAGDGPLLYNEIKTAQIA